MSELLRLIKGLDWAWNIHSQDDGGCEAMISVDSSKPDLWFFGHSPTGEPEEALRMALLNAIRGENATSV